MQTLNEYSKQIHELNVSKGWWEDKRAMEEVLMLILTEISEATEEVRNAKPLFYWYTPTGIVSFQDAGNSFELRSGDNLLKPEGEIVEIADAAIRLLDFIGAMGFNLLQSDLDKMVEEDRKDPSWDELVKKPLVFHFLLCGEVFGIFQAYIAESPKDGLQYMYSVFTKMVVYAEKKGMDLFKVIDAKLKYNQTRPYRHGNKKH